MQVEGEINVDISYAKRNTKCLKQYGDNYSYNEIHQS